MPSQPSGSFSKLPVRASARLNLSVEKRLLAYAAAAGAALAAISAPAEAEIVYTPCNTPLAPPIFGHPPSLTPLDLNNDGAADFNFGMFSTGRGSFGSTTYLKFVLAIGPNRVGNAVVRGQAPRAAAPVAAGQNIGSGDAFSVHALYVDLFSFKRSFTTRTSGSWGNIEFAYVGLKFLINGQWHYGWARVKFPYPGDVSYPSIYGYAYESTPNQSIVAGQISGAEVEAAEVVAADEVPPASLGMLAAGAPWRLWQPQSPAFAVRQAYLLRKQAQASGQKESEQ